MEIKKRLAIFLIMILLMGGCKLDDVSTVPPPDDGSGGGGTGTGTPTAGMAAASIDYAIAGMNIGFIGLTSNKPSFSSFEETPTGDFSEGFDAFFENTQDPNSRTVSPLEVQTICSGGGTAVSVSGIDAETLRFSITVKFEKCVILSQGVTLDLTLKMVFPDVQFIPISLDWCNGLRVNAVITGTRSISGLDFDNLITFTDYEMDLTSNGCDSDGLPNDFSLLASGVLSYKDNLDSQNSIDLNEINLSVVSSPVAGGINLLFDGTFQVSSSCFEGEVTVDTLPPVFYPFGLGACPTSGVLIVGGAVPGTVTYTDTVGQEVRVDDGGEIAIFDSCEEVVACR